MVSMPVANLFKTQCILDLGKSNLAQGDELSAVTIHMAEFFRLRNKPEMIEKLNEPVKPPDDSLKPQSSLFMDFETLHTRAAQRTQ